MELLIIFGAIFFLFLLPSVLLILKARKQGASVSFTEATTMRFRKTASEKLFKAIGIARKNNLNIKVATIETHVLAGGNPVNLVNGMVEIKENDLPVTYSELAAIDLSGQDISEVLKKTYKVHEVNLSSVPFHDLTISLVAKFRYGSLAAFASSEEATIEDRIKKKLDLFANTWDGDNAEKASRFLKVMIFTDDYWQKVLLAECIEQNIEVVRNDRV
ncbi:MAG: flotillin-like FloA family protein [Cyclobacteriaceae bacterium]